MKPIVLVLGIAWLLSLAAAFLVGQGSRPSQESARSDEGAGYRAPRSAPLGKSPRAAEHGARGASIVTKSERGAAGIVASRTPREAVVELAQLNDPVERAKGFLALIETLQAEDFQDVVADFRALGMTEQRMSEYSMLLHAWGQTDPEGALAYAMKETGTPFARQTILASWAADDPSAALAFARDNHKGEGGNSLLVGVIRGIAPQDLGRATELLQELPYSRERGDALQSMLPFVMQDGAEVALSWTESIADERLKTGALTYIVNNLSQSQPDAAAQLVVNLDNEAAAVQVADEVGGSLAKLSIERAIAWSEGLQDKVRSEAVEGIIGPYASQDPRAASQWLESLAGSTNLDAAIRSFAWTSQRAEPQLAAEWIGQMGNEERRNEMYRGVLSRWLGSDAESATAWIQANPNLPEAVRQLPERVQREREQRDAERARSTR